MQNLEELRAIIGDHGKDVKINLQTLVNQDNDALSTKQIFGVALASAYATKEKNLIKTMENEVQKHLSDVEIKAVKIATTIMAMNNVYYRFAHLSEDKEYLQMPAGLRMQGIRNHGIDKIDFEIFSLAVSAINGCGMCMDAHAVQIVENGLTKTQVQMVVKIAAVINSVAQVLTIQNQE